MKQKTHILGALLLVLGTGPVAGQGEASFCQQQARNDLETLFCHVRQREPQALNVTLAEFRNNPSKTQRLLLKRPAERLGLALPEPESTLPKPGKPNTREGGAVAQAPEVNEPASQPRAGKGLSACQLRDARIICAGQDYWRLRNRANSALPRGALTAQNRLDMPPPPGDAAAVNNYLHRSYRRYLEKMHAIGLAGETWSYTKFHRLFAESRRQDTDFAQRMNTMFDYLKRDKAQNQAPPTGATGPQSLTECYRLGADWIVCDNVQNNWLFKRNGRN